MSLAFVVESDVIFHADWVVVLAVGVGVTAVSAAVLEHWEWVVLERHSSHGVCAVGGAGTWVLALAWLIAEAESSYCYMVPTLLRRSI